MNENDFKKMRKLASELDAFSEKFEKMAWSVCWSEDKDLRDMMHEDHSDCMTKSFKCSEFADELHKFISDFKNK